MSKEFSGLRALLVLFLIAVVPCDGPSLTAQIDRSTSSVEKLRAPTQQRLDAILAAGQFPGVTAGIALADGTSFAIASGLSDRSTKRAMLPSDLMLQGSVGKTYAAALAMQLLAEGRLRLDDKIAKYFAGDAWFARLPNAPDITVRMLMNHTSGLVRYEFKDQFTRDLTARPDKVWKPEELVAYILDTAPPFAAGSGWEYSDTNYIVLGMIIERLTRAGYYDLVQKRLLDPLKLKNTVPSNSRRIVGLVQGYAGTNNPFGGKDEMLSTGIFAINPQFERTGGGMASTTDDLARWAKAMYEGRAFPPAMLKEMLNGVPARLGPNARYGLGVIIRPTPFGPSYGHSGFFPGYMTEMMYFPDHKLAIAVQVNTSVPRTLGRPLARFVADLAEVIVQTR
ncbi:MAG: serine hydrolase domain-containing protein [Acidobacteriota bacterium]